MTETVLAPKVQGDRRGPTVLLAVGHGSVDIYQGFVPVLVPFLVAERHYDYVAVSGFVLAATVLSSVVQPLFGLLTDRWAVRGSGRWLVPVSMLVTGLGVALLGVGGEYWLTLAVIALSGVGVAAYHPEGARLARSVTGGEPVRMSWFSLGGNVGFALAPVLATPVLAVWGLSAAPLLIVPALIGIAVSAPLLRRSPAAGAASRGGGPAGTGSAGTGSAAGASARRAGGSDNWPAFGRLSSVIMLRSVAFVGLSTFLGLFVQQRLHDSAAASGFALFSLFAGGAVGTVLGGRLAARWGRLRVLRAAYVAAAVAIAGVVLVPGPAVLVFVAAAALTLYMPFSLHITLGQDYLPNRIGTASGVTLGLAVSVGGVFAPVLGLLAKATSLHTTLACLVVLPALAWLLARRLPDPTPPA
jgi:MFS transporter, FSR family, fosmidomycin resistance protein